MRTIPDAVRQEIEAATSSHALLPFLTITHPKLVTPIRVVSDRLNYILDGAEFIGAPFEVAALPDGESAPRTQLRVANVDRKIGEAIRAISDRAMVALDVRSSADFDLTQDPRVEIGTSVSVYSAQFLELIDVTVTPIDVTGTIFLRDFAQEPWPGIRCTQSRTPGLFR